VQLDNEQFAVLVAQEVSRVLSPVLTKLAEEARPTGEWVTLQEAARLTSFSYDFIYDAVRKGDLPAVKKGTDWRVAVTDVRTWMEKDRGQSPLPPRSQLSDLINRHMPGLSR
jgi:excisionase family DNA binding protein